MERLLRDNKKGHRFLGLNLSMIVMSVVPFAIIGIIIGISVAVDFRKIILDEVSEELKNTAMTVRYTYEYAYEGDYKVVGKEQVALVKGEKVLNGDYDLIDKISEETGYEVSLFYGNTRVLTTIKDSSGERLVGTTIRDSVTDKIIVDGEGAFFDNIKIHNRKYFSYYLPIKNSNGLTVGMIAVLKPASVANADINKKISTILLILFIGILIMILISLRFSNSLIRRIHKIKDFLVKIANGDFRVKLDARAVKSQDEISEIGRAAEKMQYSLRKLIEQDALTEINNRRYGDKMLEETHKRYVDNGVSYVVAIADIDYFKKVNDTYGHECGDMVLKAVASVFKKNMVGKGFVARWGGEEFLVVFDGDTIEKAYDYMEIIANEIRDTTIEYNDKTVKVTITCGMAEGTNENVNIIIKKADDKLYEGKGNGRNQIVA